MTNPGVPASPGFPSLDPVAQQAIRTAQSRLEVLTRGNLPFPVRQLSDEEKAEALKSANDDICRLCGGFHAAPNTPACPRVASFELNGDDKLVKGTFWPDGMTDSAVDLDAEGNVVGVHHETHRGWPVDRVVLAADLAEQDGEGEAASGLHPA